MVANIAYAKINTEFLCCHNRDLVKYINQCIRNEYLLLTIYHLSCLIRNCLNTAKRANCCASIWEVTEVGFDRSI